MTKSKVSRRTFLSASVAIAIGAILLGFIIGRFSLLSKVSDKNEAYNIWLESILDEAEDGNSVRKLILEEMKAENIKENLRYLTRNPHLAGTPSDKEGADYIKNLWDSQGLHSSRIVPYNVLLSYPDPDNPNHLKILNPNGSTYFQSQQQEIPLIRGENLPHPDAVPPFNAYAPAGVVEGDIVYANHARSSDFQKLKELGVDVSDKIVIAKYGKGSRSGKENTAYLNGAKGLILFGDPANYALEGRSSVYPSRWYLPGTGVQRGTIIRSSVSGSGDPLTPGYPSTEHAFREDESTLNLPHIPVHPICYDDAIQILREMDGPTAPDEWRGGLNVTYRLGPGLRNGRKIKLEVYNKRERRMTYNVIGMIRGSLEPDRYVMIGNHRDAWVFGAIDPSSGTAVMLEISRVMANLVTEEKWQPRRSIVFCSWGAEEYGLVGSTEWAEEFSRTVAERAVAYLNVDMAINGNYTFRAKTTPILQTALFEAAKKVPDVPFPGHSSSVYDTWLARNMDDDTNLPYLSNMGSGSDYGVLFRRYGVPAVDIRYTYDALSLRLPSHPLYHTMYEDFHLVSEVMDPSFEYHLAVGRVWGELARNLADSLIIPFKPTDYAMKMKRTVDDLKNLFADNMATHNISFDQIDSAMIQFTDAAESLEAEINNMKYTDNPFEVRKINDQLMLLERAFIDPLGLPDRPYVRHVTFGPSRKAVPYRHAFPGLVELMYDISKAESKGTNPDAIWSQLDKHMSVVAFTLQSAATTLMDVGIIASSK